MSNRNSDENRNRTHINYIYQHLLPRQQFNSKCSGLLNVARWINFPRLLKCSWAALEKRTQSVVFRLKVAQRWDVRSVGGGFASHGSPMETGGRPPKSAYLLWPTSQVSWSTAARKQCSPCFIEKKPAWSSLPFFLRQHIWTHLAFEHFEQKQSNAIRWMKRQHFIFLVDCASILSAEQIYFLHGSTF